MGREGLERLRLSRAEDMQIRGEGSASVRAGGGAPAQVRNAVTVLFALLFVLGLAPVTDAQTRRAPAPKPVPPTPVKVAPEMTCPNPLGTGIKTKVAFCDVMSASDPAAGVLITLPPHRGPVTLTFDLHNRHTYSEEQEKAKRAYARYTAGIGALTMDNTLISRAAIESEFRNASDLVDRIDGGAGPGGVKAVAPSGTQAITIVIPAEVTEKVSLLGEKLTAVRLDGTSTYSQPGRPIAVVSNVMIEYVPGPPPKPVPPPRQTTTKPTTKPRP